MPSLRPVWGAVGSLRHRPGQRRCPPRRSEILHVTCLAQCPARSKHQVDVGGGGDGHEPACRSLCSGQARFPSQWRSARVCGRASPGPLAASAATRLGLSVKGAGAGGASPSSAFPCLGAAVGGAPVCPSCVIRPLPCPHLQHPSRWPAGRLFMFVAFPVSFLLGLGCPVEIPH